MSMGERAARKMSVEVHNSHVKETVEMDPFHPLFVALTVVFSVFIAYSAHRIRGTRARRGVISPTADTLERGPEMLENLRTAMVQKAPVTVRLNGRGASYETWLRAVDKTTQPPVLTMDELYPEVGNELIRDAQFIGVQYSLRDSSDGAKKTPYLFTASFLGTGGSFGSGSMLVEFPRQIRRDQKRNHLRVEPPLSRPVSITFSLGDEEFTERVVNISGGGVGFYTNVNGSSMKPGTKLSNVQIDLPTPLDEELVIVYAMDRMKNPVMVDGTAYHYYCGARFEAMDDGVRETVVRYVIEVEREDLKRINRAFE